MGKSESARQKKLAKKKSKRDTKRKDIARMTSNDPTVALANIAAAPVFESLIPKKTDQGMGIAVLTRRLPDGRLALATYLLDMYCLGVKDTMWRICSPAQYRENLTRIQSNSPTRAVSPETLTKMVLGAVEYARDLGLAPHPDFRHSRKLLEGFDPELATESFTYGYNGKPMFIQGPRDTPERTKYIMNQLSASGHKFGGADSTANFIISPEHASSLNRLEMPLETESEQEVLDSEDMEDIDLIDMDVSSQREDDPRS
jgi:hypothetical protein